MPKLLVLRRAEVLAEYELGDKKAINIGSVKENDIVLVDKSVSEHHSTITRTKEGYEIKDNNTITGTRVNEKTITVREFQPGDAAGIGPYQVFFVMTDARGAQSGPAAATSPVYALLGIYGHFEGKKFLVRQGDTHIGREKLSPKGVSNDIVLSGDMTASKGHARITCSGTACQLMDVGSTGGVAVNGKKVGQLNEVPLSVGDEVAIGRTIFRFVVYGQNDYALPTRHSIFLLKIRKPVSRALTYALLVAGVIGIAWGAGGIAVLNSTVKRLDLSINQRWTPQDNMVRNATAEYDITATPVIGDIDSNGTNDVVYLNSSGALFAWNGKTGAQLWDPPEIFNSGKTSPALCDMNNDGILDIVAVSDASMLYIIDGATGGIIRRESLGGSVADLSPAVGDIDGDGKPDVVAVSEEGMVHFVYAPGFEQRVEKYTEFVDGPLLASPVIVAAKKISPMVVIPSCTNKVYFFDGKSREKKTIDMVEASGKSHLMAAAAGVGDLNGDGIPEVVVQSNVPQYVSAIDTTRFEVTWTYFVEPIPPAELKHHASPVIADFNGDGLNDVGILSANGGFYALKGKTGYPAGELLWKIDVPSGGRLIGSPALCDLDKNGLMNVAFGTEDGSIIVLRSQPRRKEMEIVAAVKASNAPITSAVLVADVNGDRKLDLVFSNALNSVQILGTNMRVFRNLCSWPAFLGGCARAGSEQIMPAKGPYVIKLAVGIMLVLLVAMLRWYIAKKRLARRPVQVRL